MTQLLSFFHTKFVTKKTRLLKLCSILKKNVLILVHDSPLKYICFLDWNIHWNNPWRSKITTRNINSSYHTAAIPTLISSIEYMINFPHFLIENTQVQYERQEAAMYQFNSLNAPLFVFFLGIKKNAYFFLKIFVYNKYTHRLNYSIRRVKILKFGKTLYFLW